MLSSAGQLRRDEGDDLPRFYRTPVAARRERALKLRSQYLCLAAAVAASKICNPHLKALGRFRRSDNQNLAGPTCLVQRLPGLVVDLRTGRTGPTHIFADAGSRCAVHSVAEYEIAGIIDIETCCGVEPCQLVHWLAALADKEASVAQRSEEHKSELPSLMPIHYA